MNLGHIAWQAFYWPGGALVGNLLASVIWSSVFDWRLKHHHKKTISDIKDHINSGGHCDGCQCAGR